MTPDLQAPIPTGYSLDSNQIVLTDNGFDLRKVDLEFSFSDDGSGFAYADVAFLSPSGHIAPHVSFRSDTIISGSRVSGVFEPSDWSAKLNKYAESGTYKIDTIYAVDEAGNTAQYSRADLIDLGIDITGLTLIVQSNTVADLTAPLPTGYLLEDTQLLITEDGFDFKDVGLQFSFSDNLSGFAYADIHFLSPSGSESPHVAVHSGAIISGSRMSGTFGPVNWSSKLAQDAETGIYEFDYIWAVDEAGNGKSYGRADLVELGIDVYDLSIQLVGKDEAPSSTLTSSFILEASNTSVPEGSSAAFTLITTNVAPGTAVPYTVSGVSSADIVGGVMSGSAVVTSSGQTAISIPLAADNLTEGTETLTVTAQGQSASVTVEDTSRAQFANVTGVSASTSAVDEGSVATFTVTSTNADAGKQYAYSITGIDAADLLTEELSGFVTIGANGTGVIQLPINPDSITEGTETLTLTVEGKSGSIAINDTSKGTSSYTVTGLTSSINEGEVANFTVQASNTAAGSSVPYKITGVAAADFSNKSLEGIVVINSAGVGKIALQIEADNALEGDEVFTIVVGDASGSMTILDTSNPGKPFEQSNTSANEAFVAPAGTTRFEIAARSDEVSVRSTDGGKTWVVTSRDTGADTLTGFKRIKLEDSTIALDFSPGETSYKSVMLIGAAFGKDFVPGYFGAGVSLFDSGSSMQDIAKLIADIGLIEQVIGDGSDSAWVKHVYKNVVGAEPDLLTEAVFVNWLTTGAYSRGDLLALAAELPLLESQVDMTGYQTNGMTYSAFI